MRSDRRQRQPTIAVLFVSDGNPAPALFAEAITNRLGAGRFLAQSIIEPSHTRMDPRALEVLRKFNYRTVGFRHRSRDQFHGPKAPSLDYVLDLNPAAGAQIWPGHPIVAAWPIADPAMESTDDAQLRQAYGQVYGRLYDRISILVTLPLSTLDRAAITRWLQRLGSDEDVELLAADPYSESLP
jgi:arsenate reductase (thioredoxin)